VASRRIVLVVSVLLVGLVGLFVVALVVGEGQPPLRAADVQRFEAAVLPAVRQGGETVELGVKVAMRDLSVGRGPAPEVVAQQAQSWTADLTRARGALVAVVAPPALAECRRELIAALDAYIDASRAVRGAALAASDDRERLLDAVVTAGRRGDRLFDRASSRLQAARRQVGLPSSVDFPDPDS
jgi:hypothetical protein